jgi:hypothetical protein
MATANIPKEPLGSRVDPPDDSAGVEHIARDTDAT